MTTAPSRLPQIATDAVTELLDRSPVTATYLGDHTRDGLLDDPSESAAQARRAQLRSTLAGLDALSTGAGTLDEDVDAAVLRTVLSAELLELDELREDDWNPMRHNPGGGLHALLSRPFAPLPERLASVASRLAAVPGHLAAARERLADMSPVHVETAVTQLGGTLALIDTALPAALAECPSTEVERAVGPARAALLAHVNWLREQLPHARRSARIGPDRFRAKLAMTLDTVFDPATLLARAEVDLVHQRQVLAEQVARFHGGHGDDEDIRAVLDELAAEAPTDATILGLCHDAVLEATRFVREHDLVTVHDDPIAVVEMPEIDRGVAAAYCRQNGPLETALLPTEFAVSPTPAGWSAEQSASFYREYNLHMLANLTVHEAMPGHAVQLMHANRHRAGTPVRAIWRSGTFVEGWAVYSEKLMVERGFRSDVSPRAAAALHIQQLKMALRTIINTILDIRFHCDDLDEAAAMELMTMQGFQEPGEAAGKWRRVQLSSTQLCTYYVGVLEVSEVAAELRAAHPNWSERALHDAMLAHGSPPARHLRTLLGLPAEA